jgi:beta-xylosidase
VAARLSVVLAVLAPSPALAVSTSPVYAGDFPDPFVLAAVSGGATYWTYSTGSGGRNLQVMHSSDLRVWSGLSDPLPVLPKWASVGHTWAPGVLVRGNTYLMYYTVRQTATGRQCISVARASKPGGPFSDTSSGPLKCQLAHGGSIDPEPFVAPDGTPYLVWKSDDNAIGRPTKLWAQQLSSQGTGLVGSETLLLTQSATWQIPVIEGPSMVLVGSTYYLLYGANRWDSSSAAIGYATCTGPLGPCTNASTTGPWMASHGAAIGPSGPTIFTDSAGARRLGYHAWSNGVVGYPAGVRSLWIDTLTFPAGVPTLS